MKTKRLVIWKDIPEYEGIYKISNKGEVKSLKRLRKSGLAYSDYMPVKERILKPILNKYGYLGVNLAKNGKITRHTIHRLVAITFLHYIPCGRKVVPDHKNFIKSDNHVKNIKIITQRKNTNKKHLKSTSKYVGVHWNKKNSKWIAQIHLNGERKYLGSFTNEKEAHKAYKKALRKP